MFSLYFEIYLWIKAKRKKNNHSLDIDFVRRIEMGQFLYRTFGLNLYFPLNSSCSHEDTKYYWERFIAFLPWVCVGALTALYRIGEVLEGFCGLQIWISFKSVNLASFYANGASFDGSVLLVFLFACYRGCFSWKSDDLMKMPIFPSKTMISSLTTTSKMQISLDIRNNGRRWRY